MVRSMHNQAAVFGGYSSQTEEARHDRLTPRNLTCWNPRHCLVSVVDDQAAALRAVAELYEAGFVGLDIRLVLAPEFAALENAQLARHPLARVVTGMRAFGDEALISAKYAAEARRGHHVLIVFAPGDARTSRALTIVTRYQAHTVHYYSQWIIRGVMNQRGGTSTGP